MAKKTSKNKAQKSPGIFTIYSIGTDDRPASRKELREFGLKLMECKKTGKAPAIRHRVNILRFCIKPIPIFSIGTEAYPATPDDIKGFEEVFEKSLSQRQDFMVCGHAVQLSGNID